MDLCSKALGHTVGRVVSRLQFLITQSHCLRNAKRRTRRHQVATESLETRILPATIVVTSLIDAVQTDGRVSLREAIQAANTDLSVDGSGAGRGADQIVFATGLSGITTLRSGQLTISSPISISGNGVATTIIDAGRLSRIFNITSTAGDVTLKNMTVRNGQTKTVQNLEPGGAILFSSPGTLLVDQCALVGNRTTEARSHGGAIQVSKGSLVLSKSSFTDNFVEGGSSMGGAVAVLKNGLTAIDCVFTGNAALGNSGGGGAILSQGALRLQRCNFVNNSTKLYFSPGGAVYGLGSTAVVDTCVFTNNTTAGENSWGGAVCFPYSTYPQSSQFFPYSTYTYSQIIGSRFNSNRTFGTNAHGGAVFRATEVSGSRFKNNQALLGDGGAVSAVKIKVNQSTFTGNKALAGGALSSSECVVENSLFETNSTIERINNGEAGGAIKTGSLNLMATTVRNNFARHYGGGIYASGDAVILQSTISGNSTGPGGHGGGLRCSGRMMTVIQSTISGNIVSGKNTQGGISKGGGISFSGSTFRLVQTTVTGNSAIDGVGGGCSFLGAIDVSVAPVFENSIVAGNNDGGYGPDIKADRSLTLRNSLVGTNSGTRLIENAVGDAEGNLIGGPGVRAINPQLGPLQNNGGFTFTHSLLPGSPALNRGRNSLAVDSTNGNSPLLFDQRGVGFDRIQGGVVDIGAVEAQIARASIGNTVFLATDSRNSAVNTSTVIISTNESMPALLGSYPVVAPAMTSGPARVESVRGKGASDKNSFIVNSAMVEGNCSLVMLGEIEILELLSSNY